MTADEFLAAAKDENKYREREHLCEAYWYVGAVQLAAGDTAKAKECFEKCVATKTTRSPWMSGSAVSPGATIMSQVLVPTIFTRVPGDQSSVIRERAPC